MNRKLADVFASRLRLERSREQIAGWLKQTFAGDEDYHASHETIYRSLYISFFGEVTAQTRMN